MKFFDQDGPRSHAHNDKLGGDKNGDGQLDDKTPDGICQVCHTQTGHWRTDGTRGALAGSIHETYNGTGCMGCHPHANGFKASFADHAGPPVNLSSLAFCAGCHDPAANLDIVKDIHKADCANCHSSVPALRTDYAGGTVAANMDCGGCHVQINASWANHSVDHTATGLGVVLPNSATTPPTSNCVNCHSGDIIMAVHDRGAAGRPYPCQQCHDIATGATIPGFDGYGDASGGGGECSFCHSIYFDNHTHADNHTVAQRPGVDLSAGTLCGSCHGVDGGDAGTAALDDWSEIRALHNVATNGAGPCATCHNSLRDINVAAPTGTTVQDVIGAGADPTGCLACHPDRSSGHGDHVAMGVVTGIAKCTGCHDQSGSGTSAHFIGTVHNNNCGLCHTDPGGGDYSLKAGSSAEGHGAGGSYPKALVNTCVTCHSAYDADFDGAHQNESHVELTGTAECTGCHAESIVTALGSSDVHGDTCTNCHTDINLDGRLRAGANGSAAGHTVGGSSSCESCHEDGVNFTYSSKFANTSTGHKLPNDHTGIGSAANCTTTCHVQTIGSAIVATTHNGTCALCHIDINTNGALRVGTNGAGNNHAIGATSTCASCHEDGTNYTYSTNFASLAKGHKVQDHSGVGATASCAVCHSEAIVNLDATADEHGDSCTNCHTNTTTSGILKAAPRGDASGHQNGTPSLCADCHGDHASSWYYHGVGRTPDHSASGLNGVLPNSANSPATVNCTGCHSEANLITGTHDRAAAGSTYSCQQCHNSAGVLVNGNDGYGDARLGAGGGAECATCHTSQFDGHSHDTGHTVALQGSDLSAGAACNTCHGSDGADAGTTKLDSWDEIQTLHNVATNGAGACATCHNASRDVNPVAPTGTTVAMVIAAGADPTSCLACHGDRTVGHGPDHVAEKFVTSTASCVVCHNQADPVTGVHAGQGCFTCHDESVSPVTLKGSAANHRVPADGAVNTCASCHDNIVETPAHEHTRFVPGLRNSPYLGTLTCFKSGCHNRDTFAEHLQPGGIAYQKFQGYGVSFDCALCHQNGKNRPGQTFNADPVIHNAIKTGTTDNLSAYCNDCHDYSAVRLDIAGLPYSVAAKYSNTSYRVSSKHHATSHTRAGNCTACHIDPRIDRYGPGNSLPAPKMLPCKECHAQANPSGGSFGTGQFTIYKTRTGTQNASMVWSWNFSGPIANTHPAAPATGVAHQWNVDGGMIQSFGACLFCHKMRPYHAYPGKPSDSNPNSRNFTTDPPYFAGPGRSTLAVKYADHRLVWKYYKDVNPGTQQSYKNDYKIAAQNDFKQKAGVTYARVVYDPATDPTGMVPTVSFCTNPSYSTQATCESNGHWWRPGHVMGTPATFYIPTFDTLAGGDTINISSASYSGGNVSVAATNTNTTSGYTLHAVYSGRGYPMTKSGAANWSVTIPNVRNFSSDGYFGRVFVISIDTAANQNKVRAQAVRDIN